MNGELKCHNSESIIIKIVAIVPHSHVCEYVSNSSAKTNTSVWSEHAAARPTTERVTKKKSPGHVDDPCSWAFMASSTNGGQNQWQQRSIAPFQTHRSTLGIHQSATSDRNLTTTYRYRNTRGFFCTADHPTVRNKLTFGPLK